MIIHGMTVCVGEHYASLLQSSIGKWMKGLKSLCVIGDQKTEQHRGWPFILRMCAEGFGDVSFPKTNAFYEGGRVFGKSNAMQHVWPWFNGRSQRNDWFLFFDADVLPPENWFEVVKAANPQPGNLYGAKRVTEDGKPVIHEREIAGYFQLFHGSDPLVKGVTPLLDTSWTHAGGYDTVFQNKWPESNRHFLPLTVTHLGEPFNWYGTTPEAKGKMAALLEGWKKHGHGNVPGERV